MRGPPSDITQVPNIILASQFKIGGDVTNITRRRLLTGATAVAAAGAFVTRAVFAPTKVLAQRKPGATAEGVKALVYDVFGT